MENFLVDNVWHIRQDQQIDHYRSVITHLFKSAAIGYEFDGVGEIIAAGIFRLKIYVARVENPRVVILFQQDNQKLADLKSLYSALYTKLPAGSVMTTTDKNGCCPFCNTHISKLALFPKDNLVPTSFGCCGYTFSFKDSLEVLLDYPLRVTSAFIMTADQNTLSKLNGLFPDHKDRLFYFPA
jgi:hypothetical protein